MTHLKWVQHDGGRAAAGFSKGKPSDCVSLSLSLIEHVLAFLDR
jgi:hypothetical protein